MDTADWSHEMQRQIEEGRISFPHGGNERQVKNKRFDFLLFAGIVCVTVTLRAPITAVGPVIGSLKASFPFSSGVFGLLTTIPLLMFALVSPFVCGISNRIGTGRSILYSLILVGIGILLRSYAAAVGLFLGTVLIGFGIAFGNVLIPGVIKARFPEKVGLVTSAFTISMSAFAAISSAASHPLSQMKGTDWRFSLAVWLILIVVALVIWWPQRTLSIRETCAEDPAGLAPRKEPSVYRSPVAWWLTVLMGAQSCLFYFFTAWLPTMLQAKGITANGAGYITFAFQLMTIPASFLIPTISVRHKDQRGITTVIALIYVASIALFYFAQSVPLLTVACMLCGLSTGSCFSLCMLLISLRTQSAGRATSLSGMVQAIGYAVGAIGPILAGWLFDLTGGWNAAVLCAACLTVAIFVSGRQAGKDCSI